ncbi:hypothetical protein MMC25_004897 [Agyrium rufum]|nr:hypothetical protein [Agyrium rufum]
MAYDAQPRYGAPQQQYSPQVQQQLQQRSPSPQQYDRGTGYTNTALSPVQARSPQVYEREGYLTGENGRAGPSPIVAQQGHSQDSYRGGSNNHDNYGPGAGAQDYGSHAGQPQSYTQQPAQRAPPQQQWQDRNGQPGYYGHVKPQTHSKPQMAYPQQQQQQQQYENHPVRNGYAQQGYTGDNWNQNDALQSQQPQLAGYTGYDDHTQDQYTHNQYAQRSQRPPQVHQPPPEPRSAQPYRNKTVAASQAPQVRPAAVPLQRSVSEEAVSTTKVPQYDQRNGYSNGRSDARQATPIQEWVSDERTRKDARLPDPKRPRGKTPTPRERILVEPTSPETISWDNPFPTFPTIAAKKKVDKDGGNSRPGTSASNRTNERENLARPQTADGSRNKDQQSRRAERPDQQVNASAAAAPPQPRIPQEIPQQLPPLKTKLQRPVNRPNDSSYSLPSSPRYGGFPRNPVQMAAPQVNQDSRGEQPDGRRELQQTIAAAKVYVSSPIATRAPILPHQPATGSNLRDAHHVRSSSSEGPKPTNVPNFSQGLRKASLGAATPDHGNFDMDSYYDAALQARTNSSSARNGLCSPREEDMPNFAAMSVNSATEPHGIADQDLHMQATPLTNGQQQAPLSPISERGRDGHQDPRIQGQVKDHANRSGSQPPNRIQQQYPETGGRTMGYDVPSSSPQNPDGYGQQHLSQVQHPPRPFQPQRGPSTESAMTTKSAPAYATGPPGPKAYPPNSRLDRPMGLPNQYPPSLQQPPHSGMQGHGGPRGGFGMTNNSQQRNSPMSPPPQDQRRPSTEWTGDGMQAQRILSNDRPGQRPGGVNGMTSPSMQLPSSRSGDILPEHPAPVRPGLNPGYTSPKPAPVRQYNNTTPSPVPQTGPPPQQPKVVAADHRRTNSIVQAGEELARRRQAAQAKPNDFATQLALAKFMGDAAPLLANDGGRITDSKQKARNLEKYIFDAHKMVKKLVAQGYPEAMFYLADCHGRGLLGLQADAKEAFNLYQSAAKAGHPASTYRVAVCCEMGLDEGGGTRKDPLKAVQWYKRAASLGDVPAMYKMGMIQLKGLLGQPRNPREAIIWLKRAAERADADNPHALHELGLLFESARQNDNIIRDETYSLQLFTQAAELGYKFSQFRLGAAYEYGNLGCAVDARQSIAWYSKAAVQEEHQSELALSGWYLTGIEGVLAQSDTEAYLWARKAAQAGLAKAEYAMGYFTEVGIGAPANLEDAKRWYWRAASQNFPKARERLEDLRKGGARMEKSRVSRSAVNKGSSDGDCRIM